MKPLTQDEWVSLVNTAMMCVLAWGLCGILGLDSDHTACAMVGTLIGCALGEWRRSKDE